MNDETKFQVCYSL